MVFAAQKLRRAAELKSPTVIVLVDRTDLDTQISGTFNASDIPNVEATESIKDLQKMLPALLFSIKLAQLLLRTPLIHHQN